MTPQFQPKLVNGNCGDPALYIDFLHQRRAILFDCGDLHALSSRQILKISHIFISHTHMDHFIGFDHLLRLCLGREKLLHVYGPEGFIRHLSCKLGGYTWNLVQNYTSHFEIRACEITPHGIEDAQFICREGFILKNLGARPFSGFLLDEPSFSVTAFPLTHSIPSLGFALQEKFHININNTALEAMALSPGPWLNELKSLIWEEQAEDVLIDVPGLEGQPPKRVSLGWLRKELVIISRGERIAYVADTAWNPQNAADIVRLARGADYFFCEGAFMQTESDQAQKTCHLTAAQSGQLARQSNALRFIPFHFSPRYHETPQMVEQEARQAFSGG